MSTHGIRCTITNNTNTYVVSTENTITPMPYFNVCLPFAFDSIDICNIVVLKQFSTTFDLVSK